MSTSTNKINLTTATIVSMNCMMGAGIFATPVAVAMMVGPAGILSMLFVIISVWFMAYTLSLVAAKIPKEGSFYSYASSWGGHIVGLIAAWCYEIGLLVAMGFLCRIAGQFAAPYIPGIDAWTLGLTFLVSLTVLNMLGVVVSKAVQYAIISLTALALVSTILVCFGHASLSNLQPFAPHGVPSIFKAMSILIFGLFGFESAASLFPIVENPQKNVPKALGYSITIVGTLYILFIAAVMLAVPNELFVSKNMPITEALAQVLTGVSAWVIPIINVAIVTAILGVTHSMIWSSSSLLNSLFKRKKSAIARGLVSNNIINPTSSVLIVGLCILASFLWLQVIFSLVAMLILFAYILSMLAVFKKSTLSVGQNIIVALGIITASGIFYVAANEFISTIIAALS